MKIGYARVSTAEQNLERQLDALTKEGCKRIYKEKQTGMKEDRPELIRLLDNIRDNDIIIVTELNRLSRSTKDLFTLISQIQKVGADLKSLKEPWPDTGTPQGKLIFTIFAGISQFERDLISDRTKEGLAAARARGRKGGRPKVNEKEIELALKMYKSRDYSIAEISKACKISKATLYNYLHQNKSKKT